MSEAQLALDLSQRPAMGREDFFVAECNAAATAWLDRWPDWPSPALVVHGPAGSGKTHLRHVWQARVTAAGEGAGVLAAEALAGRAPVDLLDGASCAVVEDIDRSVCGDRERETGLFHLYNHVAGRGGQLLLTGRGAPGRWRFGLADLRSRVVAAPAVAIEPPDDHFIAAVLVKLFADRQLRVGQEVLNYLLPRMERSLAAAWDMVAALDQAALAQRRNITVPLAREVLGGHKADHEEGEQEWT